MTTTTTTAFADRIRQLRRDRNLSQRELATLLGIDYSYVSKIENDASDYPPSERMLQQMAELFEVDAEELIFQSGKIPSAYSGLLEQLALKYGAELPGMLEKLLEGDR